MSPEVEKLLAAFAVADGELIELFVGAVPEGTWPRVLAALIEAGYDITVTDLECDEGVEFGAELFADVEGRYSVAFPVGRQVWTSTPSSADAIDLQGDPRDATTPEDVDDIMRLMVLVHEVTGRPVVLVPETLDYDATAPYLTVP